MKVLIGEGFLERVQETAGLLAEALRDVSNEFGLGEVRGAGFLLALEIGRDIAPAIVDLARARGLLLNAPRPGCLRFMPALTTTPDEIDEGLDILRKVLRQMPQLLSAASL
jgi:acetylornithine/N-succinyldiaminopimelate aminotransferase